MQCVIVTLMYIQVFRCVHTSSA